MSVNRAAAGRLGPAEREALAGIARAAVEAAAEGRPPPRFDVPPGPLAEPRGAFVTLRRLGRLRGCLGRFEPEGEPLARLVAEMARAAALDDPRFPPLAPGELGDLEIEVSVLGPLRRVRPDEVRLGRDGVRIARGGRAGCFLPCVARETGWDLETFLERCAVEKAGLPPGAWREPSTTIEAFEVEEVTESGP